MKHDPVVGREIAELMGRVRLYRALLAEHGIEPPNEAGALEFEIASRRMVAAAVEFMDAANALSALYGTSKELLLTEPWREAA